MSCRKHTIWTAFEAFTSHTQVVTFDLLVPLSLLAQCLAFMTLLRALVVILAVLVFLLLTLVVTLDFMELSTPAMRRFTSLTFLRTLVMILEFLVLLPPPVLRFTSLTSLHPPVVILVILMPPFCPAGRFTLTVPLRILVMIHSLLPLVLHSVRRLIIMTLAPTALAILSLARLLPPTRRLFVMTP